MELRVGQSVGILVGQHKGELGLIVEVVGNPGREDTYKVLTLEGDTHIYDTNQIKS
ncbi:hypothetical protein ES703_84412 [subsurface metagenome]